MSTTPIASTAPDEARTRNHEQAEALRRLADFLDANPGVEPLNQGPLWVFAQDEDSAIAWRQFLGSPPVDVRADRHYKAQCRTTIGGGLNLLLAIADRVALVEPFPVAAPQVVGWLQ